MKFSVAVSVFLAIQLSAAGALAYVGPGAGISAIGSVFALVATVGLLLLGFVWYPIKRVLRKKRAGDAAADQVVEAGKDGG